MKNTIIFATGNSGKVKEVKEMLGNLDFEVLSLKESGIDSDVEESGKTFEENSVLKVRAVMKNCENCIIIADDSGLEVDALNKEPGIYSARYLGENTSFDEKMENILLRMKDVPIEKRGARFVAAVSIFIPGKGIKTVRGTFEGIIGFEKAGSFGFGYDPIFYLPERNCTAAELKPEEKNSISHRAKAMKQAAVIITEAFR